MKRTMIASATAVLTMAGSVAAATPADAAPLITGGLVNVTVTDTLNNNNILQDVNVGVGAALGLAANVCDVSVAVLSAQLDRGDATCTSTANGQRVDIKQIA
jgi:hypothetical protein